MTGLQRKTPLQARSQLKQSGKLSRRQGKALGGKPKNQDSAIRSHRDRVIDEALERAETADMTETEVSWVRDLLYDLYMGGCLRPPESDSSSEGEQ